MVDYLKRASFLSTLCIALSCVGYSYVTDNVMLPYYSFRQVSFFLYYVGTDSSERSEPSQTNDINVISPGSILDTVQLLLLPTTEGVKLKPV